MHPPTMHPPTMHPPTLSNVRLGSPEEAHRIIRLAIEGSLKEYPCRLNGDDQVRPGDVFVYKKSGKADIIRWTDGHKSSKSRNRKGFLSYIIYNTADGHNWWRKTTTLVDKTDEWHLVAYDYDDPEAHGAQLLRLDEILEPTRLHNADPGAPSAHYEHVVSSWSSDLINVPDKEKKRPRRRSASPGAPLPVAAALTLPPFLAVSVGERGSSFGPTHSYLPNPESILRAATSNTRPKHSLDELMLRRLSSP